LIFLCWKLFKSHIFVFAWSILDTINMTIELAHNYFLPTHLFFWFIFLAWQILLYYMCLDILISAMNSCDYIFMFEIWRSSGSIAILLSELLLALYTELTNFVMIAAILYVICRGQSCVEQHVFVFHDLLRWIFLQNLFRSLAWTHSYLAIVNQVWCVKHVLDCLCLLQ
jgi:hypothetical protein